MNSLLAGVGIFDRAAPGDDPVADAVTAEAVGCDCVSAFDHPVADAATAEAVGYDFAPAAGHPVRTYPADETQTLLRWIAARTTRIGIVPRVLGVPLRRAIYSVPVRLDPRARISRHRSDSTGTPVQGSTRAEPLAIIRGISAVLGAARGGHHRAVPSRWRASLAVLPAGHRRSVDQAHRDRAHPDSDRPRRRRISGSLRGFAGRGGWLQTCVADLIGGGR